jgi:hypothetical protein
LPAVLGFLLSVSGFWGSRYFPGGVGYWLERILEHPRSKSNARSDDALHETAQSGQIRRWARAAGTAVILSAAALATSPQLLHGNSCGHDFDIHLVSWFDCVNSWRHGIGYPQWTSSANYGAGEPRFIFYPPLTWMVGAALGLLLPWTLVPMALTFLLLAATGLATRALARQALGDAPATLAGLVALFSSYALFTAYERSAFGEMAGFWIPLLLLLVLRDRNADDTTLRRAFDGSAAPLALVIAGAWLSNAPLGVMASYLLAAVALVTSLCDRSWAAMLRAATSAAAGLGVAAFYLVPAAYEQRWVDIQQATNDPGLKIENSFLFGHPADPALALHNAELLRVSWIAVGMVAVALLGWLVARRQKTLTAPKRWWLPLVLIAPVVFLLQLPLSEPVWNLLPKLRFLQFPWRWLVVLEAPLGIFFAAAVGSPASRRRWVRVGRAGACGVLFLGSTAIAAFTYFQPCDDEDAVAPMVSVARSGAGFEGVYEYAPRGADNGEVATGLPDACLAANPQTKLGILDTPGANPDWWVEQNSCEAVFHVNPDTKPGMLATAGANPEHLHFSLTLPHAGALILRLRTYPAWRITVNGKSARQLAEREDGLTVVAVPEGRVELSADWTTTADVRTGRWLTLLTLALLAGLWRSERKNTAER